MTLERLAEDELVMESTDSVTAFHGAGFARGPLFPIYHFNATGLSQLLSERATVLDVFCGSAQFLKYLLSGRPDLCGIGVDLSQGMLELAAANIDQSGLTDRIQLVRGDALSADSSITERVDAVTCLSALHHCRSIDDLASVLRTIKRLRTRDGCAVWLFDLVRPEEESLVEMIPRMHEISLGSELNAAFKKDWMTSLRAGWTFEEVSETLHDVGLALSGVTANYSQLHWIGPLSDPIIVPDWQGVLSDSRDLQRAMSLARSLGWQHLGC